LIYGSPLQNVLSIEHMDFSRAAATPVLMQSTTAIASTASKVESLSRNFLYRGLDS
jgi:hypothetical protein